MAEPASPSRETVRRRHDSSSADLAQAIGKSTTSYHEPGPTELLLATPVPILHLIARLGPTIHVLTGLVQTLTWQHPTSHSVASYLMLLGWWAVCLFGETAITYGTNALGLLLLVVGYATHRKGRRSVAAPADDPSRPPRMDSTRLARAIDAARELEAALKKLRAEFQPMLDTLAWRDVDAAQEAAALLLTSYPFALVAGYYLPTRYIVAVLGSVVLAWHAPWFKVLRRALGRSLLLRFFGRLSLGILGGGRGLLREARRGRSAVRLFANARGQTKADGRPLAGSRRSSTHGPSGDSSSDEVVFLFTILEHQRWWIGLGFGPALLPNERPSWSVHALTDGADGTGPTSISHPYRRRPRSCCRRRRRRTRPRPRPRIPKPSSSGRPTGAGSTTTGPSSWPRPRRVAAATRRPRKSRALCRACFPAHPRRTRVGRATRRLLLRPRVRARPTCRRRSSRRATRRRRSDSAVTMTSWDRTGMWTTKVGSTRTTPGSARGERRRWAAVRRAVV